MRIVGLTGGIASGKSTVGRILASRGIAVIDADRVARDILTPGSPTLGELVATLGPQILDSQGALDRPAMRAAISADPAVKATLDRITHPAIRGEIGRRIVDLAQAGEPAVVVEAALLVETGSHRLYPQLIVVGCHPDVQLERLMARDAMSERDARALVAIQMPLADKERVATVVIRNDGDADELAVAVDAAWSELIST